MQKSKLYILLGWGHRISDPGYRAITQTKKFEVVPLKISTCNKRYALGSGKNFRGIIGDIERQISQPAQNDVLLGFSIGALQAYQVAQHIRFKHLILCSISPVLGADLKTYPKKAALTIFSPTQYKELEGMSYGTLITKKVSILYGDKEDKILKKRAQKIGRRKGYHLIEIKGADHKLDRIYCVAIKKILK